MIVRAGNFQGMGNLAFKTERTVFEMREEMLAALSPIGRIIVKDFEQNFVASTSNGTSFADILDNSIKAFVSYTSLPDQNMIAFISSLDAVSAATSMGVSSKTYNVLKSLSYFSRPIGRTDLPMIISDNHMIQKSEVGVAYSMLRKSDGTISDFGYPFSANVKVDYAGLPTSTSFKEYALTIGNAKAPTDFKPYYTSFSTWYVDSEGDYPAMQSAFDAYIRMFDMKYRVYSTTATKYVQIVYLTGKKLSNIIQDFRDAIAVIRWLESENNSIEIRGNVDGLKLDSYEQIIKDQFDHINGVSDAVANILNSEKIEAQKTKDATQAKIEAKKAELLKAINDKRELIKKMNYQAANYNSDLEAAKAAVEQRLKSTIG